MTKRSRTLVGLMLAALVLCWFVPLATADERITDSGLVPVVW